MQADLEKRCSQLFEPQEDGEGAGIATTLEDTQIVDAVTKPNARQYERRPKLSPAPCRISPPLPLRWDGETEGKAQSSPPRHCLDPLKLEPRAALPLRIPITNEHAAKLALSSRLKLQ